MRKKGQVWPPAFAVDLLSVSWSRRPKERLFRSSSEQKIAKAESKKAEMRK
jgi:hypothetical protein